MTKCMAGHRRQTGFTLVEVLVALLVLSIGLLGIAALHTAGMRATQTAGARTQATILAYDIIDRMRANRAEALLGRYNTLTGDVTLADFGAAAGDRFGEDLLQWKGQLAERLPGGLGAIEQPDAGQPAVVTVTVEWLDRDENRAAGAQTLQFQTTTQL